MATRKREILSEDVYERMEPKCVSCDREQVRMELRKEMAEKFRAEATRLVYGKKTYGKDADPIFDTEEGIYALGRHDGLIHAAGLIDGVVPWTAP